MKVTKMLHPKDTMTSEERLQAVINLQVPDRVPSCPFIYYFAAHYAGITVYELWSQPKKYHEAIDKCYRDLGPWDAYYHVNAIRPELYTFIMPMKSKWPGIDLPEDSICQLLEEEVMKPDDYEWVGELARMIPKFTYLPFFMRMISRSFENIGENPSGYLHIVTLLLRYVANWRHELLRMKKRGTTGLYGFMPEAAFDTFSLARGLIEFARDLKKRPQEIAKAADDLTEGFLLWCRFVCLLVGVKRVEIFVHRSSSDFISPEMFRELSFPSLKALAEGLVAAGINPILHCDGNWDMNLETLRELPAGNCVIQFDGPTDIFLAKKVLGDRVCIMGDVPAEMFVLGSPTEVDEYCHRLIEEVGKDGGYIMGAGCEIPPDARPENVKTMLDSVVKYGYYGQPTQSESREE